MPRGGPVSNNDLFEQYLTQEVIPLVETKYRTTPGARHRVLAGLSMGGGHTIYTGFRHPDLFSALGVFSPGLPGDFDRQFQTVLADPKTFNSKVGLLWVACGDHDTTVHYERVKPGPNPWINTAFTQRSTRMQGLTLGRCGARAC